MQQVTSREMWKEEKKIRNVKTEKKYVRKRRDTGHFEGRKGKRVEALYKKNNKQSSWRMKLECADWELREHFPIIKYF